VLRVQLVALQSASLAVMPMAIILRLLTTRVGLKRVSAITETALQVQTALITMPRCARLTVALMGFRCKYKLMTMPALRTSAHAMPIRDMELRGVHASYMAMLSAQVVGQASA
jgi:hypothetical protein